MNFSIPDFKTFCSEINNFENKFLEQEVVSQYSQFSLLDQKVYQVGLQVLHTILNHAMTPLECDKDYALPKGVYVKDVVKERLFLDFCMYLSTEAIDRGWHLPALYRIHKLIQHNHILLDGIERKWLKNPRDSIVVRSNVFHTLLPLSDPQLSEKQLAKLNKRFSERKEPPVIVNENQDALTRRAELIRIASEYCGYLDYTFYGPQFRSLSVLIPNMKDRLYCAKVLARRDAFLLAQSLDNFDLDGDSVIEVAELICLLATHITALKSILECGINIESYRSRIDVMLQTLVPPAPGKRDSSPLSRRHIQLLPQQMLERLAQCGHQHAWFWMKPEYQENRDNALAAIRYQPSLFNKLSWDMQEQIIEQAALAGNAFALQKWWRWHSDALLSMPDTILAALTAVLVNERQCCDQIDKNGSLGSGSFEDKNLLKVLLDLESQILERIKNSSSQQNPNDFEEAWHRILEEEARQGCSLAWYLFPKSLRTLEIAKTITKKRPGVFIIWFHGNREYECVREATGYLEHGYLHSRILNYTPEVYEEAFKNNPRIYRFLPKTMRQEPQIVRDYLRKQPWEMETVYTELEQPAWMKTANLFALLLAYCDGLLRLNEGAMPHQENLQARRFFQITAKLPLELQMVLCHRAVGSNKWIVHGRDTEWALRAALLPV